MGKLREFWESQRNKWAAMSMLTNVGLATILVPKYLNADQFTPIILVVCLIWYGVLNGE